MSEKESDNNSPFYNVGVKLSDFEIIKQLGKGSYGTVYTVKSYLDNNIYVMKKMDLNNLKERQQMECYREASILKTLNHPNIIKYYSSFLENNILYIIMEYAESGDLYSMINHYKKHGKFFEEIDIWRIAYELLNGLDYLHSSNIIHRDIKCLNLFITKDKHIKIGDLGVSTFVSNINNMHCTRVGTPLYLSPELIKEIPYDFKVDIWSFGCSIYHLAALDPPFKGGNIIALGNSICKSNPKPLPNKYSSHLMEFIEKMLNKKPDLRPTAKEAISLIPKDIIEKVQNLQAHNVEIKTRPFSSIRHNIITYNKDQLNDNKNDLLNPKKNNDSNKLINISVFDDENKDKNKKNVKEIHENEEDNKNDENHKIADDNDKTNNNKINLNKKYCNEVSVGNYDHYQEVLLNNSNDKLIPTKKEVINASNSILPNTNKNEVDKNKNEDNNNNDNKIEDINNGKNEDNNKVSFSPINKENIGININNLKENKINENQSKSKLNNNCHSYQSINSNSFRNNHRIFTNNLNASKFTNQNSNPFNKINHSVRVLNPNICNNKKNKDAISNKSLKEIGSEQLDINTSNNNIEIKYRNVNTNNEPNIKLESLDKIDNAEITTNKPLINESKREDNLVNDNNYNINNKFIRAQKNSSEILKFPNLPNTTKSKQILSYNSSNKNDSNNELNNNLEFKSDLSNNNLNRIMSGRQTINHLSLNRRPFTATSNNRINHKIKKVNKINRPTTAFKPTQRNNCNFNIPSNIINININFFNIDMNKKFLDQQLNPLSNILNHKENKIKEDTHKNFTIYQTSFNLKQLAKNNTKNDFIFDKLLKTMNYNRNNRPLTINDLVDNKSSTKTRNITSNSYKKENNL